MSYSIKREEIETIPKEFRGIASRLLNSSNFEDAREHIKRLMLHIEETHTINEYILKSDKHFDMHTLLIETCKTGKLPMPLKRQEELTFVYYLLKHIVETFKDDNDYANFINAYYYENSLRDAHRRFNSQVIKPFVDNIIEHFEEMKVNLETKERVTPVMNNISGGIVAVIQGNHNTSNIHLESFQRIDNSIREVYELFKAEDIEEEILDDIFEILETIKEQIKSENPKKTILTMCADRIKEYTQLTTNAATIINTLMNLFQGLGI